MTRNIIDTHDVLGGSVRSSPLRKGVLGDFCFNSIDDVRLSNQTDISKRLNLAREAISLYHSSGMSLQDNIQYLHERLVGVMAMRKCLPFGRIATNKDVFYSLRIACDDLHQKAGS